jgi:hypothetical protein
MKMREGEGENRRRVLASHEEKETRADRTGEMEERGKRGERKRGTEGETVSGIGGVKRGEDIVKRSSERQKVKGEGRGGVARHP